MKMVDAEKLTEKSVLVQDFKDPELGYFIVPISVVKILPIVDAVPVIRCKNCEHHKTCTHTRRLGINGYCSDAERKVDG